jgi:hypothetical protein
MDQGELERAEGEDGAPEGRIKDVGLNNSIC